MQIEQKEIFAIQIEGSVYHAECVPDDAEFTEEDIIQCGDEERNDYYFCDGCGKLIR